MRRADGHYSRIIAGLKVLLPLAALAMLSTLFLFARDRAEVSDMPFADALRGGETAREQVGAPYYSGTTARGDSLTMTAESAAPEPGGAIRADTLAATLDTPDGTRITLDAAAAFLSDGSQRARLEGGVEIASSTGYTLVTDVLTTALDEIAAESDGPVTGTAPEGRLDAGRMQIRAEADGAVQMLFTQGVKLVYQPRKD